MTQSATSKFKVLRFEDNGQCATYELDEEDHTLGNALRHIILKNPQVKFCGYALPHPNERKINIQIQVYAGEAIDALEKGFRDLIELNNIVKAKILEAKAKFGPVEIVDSEGEQEDPETGDVEDDLIEEGEEELITEQEKEQLQQQQQQQQEASTSDTSNQTAQTPMMAKVEGSKNKFSLSSSKVEEVNQEARKQIQVSPALIEAAELALDKLSHQEIRLIRETENLFKQQVNYMKDIDHLRDHIPNMEKMSGDTKRLSSLVDSSFSLVGDVCGKFRQIDLAKVRLEDSLSKIGDILDLKTCRNGVLNAMQLGNFEEAAMHIKRFLSIDQDELQKTISIICDDPTSYWPPRKMSQLLMNLDDDEPQQAATQLQTGATMISQKSNSLDPKSIDSDLKKLSEARYKLMNMCQENMARAIGEGNIKNIERFFKIFPMLNEHQDGLKRYSGYLKDKVLIQQVEVTIQSKEISHANKLAALYENIAKLIDSHQPLIETYYGPGHLIVVIRVIQKECDRISRYILEEFRNDTKLQSVAKIARSSNLQPISQNLPTYSRQNASQINLNPSKLDPRTVDKILNEISLIVSRSEVYLGFIVQRIKDDFQSKSENEAQRKANQVELYNMIFYECELNHLAQEVGGIYVMLEQFYLDESSKKAIVMDQIDIDPSHSCLISSMLDDIFFIIKKCTKRAVSTKSNELFCAIINHCVALLESTFCQVLEDRLKNQQYYTSFSAKNLDFSQAYNAIQSGRYLQSTNDQEKSNAQYFSALNNLEKACDYMKTLRGILDNDVKKLKPSLLVLDTKHDNQLEKSIACLNEFTQLINRFASIVNSSLYHLFNTSLRNRVRTELKVVMDENPDITSIITSNPNELTGFAQTLLKNVDSCLASSLLPGNYTKLVSITNDFLSSTLKSIK